MLPSVSNLLTRAGIVDSGRYRRVRIFEFNILKIRLYQSPPTLIPPEAVFSVIFGLHPGETPRWSCDHFKMEGIASLQSFCPSQQVLIRKNGFGGETRPASCESGDIPCETYGCKLF